MSRRHARDVLPDGGPPRPPVDALSGRRGHGADTHHLHRLPLRLMKILDFIKKSVAMNDDIFDFFYEALPGYEEVGRRRILLGCWGAFQNPDGATTGTRT